MEAEASVLALLPTDACPFFMMDIRTVRTCQTHSRIGFSDSDCLIEVVG
ncbi:hypothetical protein [Rhizobium lusitanum]|uniref:Uncharacterized protein n=1 Tax=Rhizobium lusitanum TaxID=293958 RepID=A0A7X0MF29_9HYPH|nr:hypothetical protein [Rhizobium lusitanum]MBB6486685.1 hypothetical protein [Rhizobium lusitanum]